MYSRRKIINSLKNQGFLPKNGLNPNLSIGDSPSVLFVLAPSGLDVSQTSELLSNRILSEGVVAKVYSMSHSRFLIGDTFFVNSNLLKKVSEDAYLSNSMCLITIPSDQAHLQVAFFLATKNADFFRFVVPVLGSNTLSVLEQGFKTIRITEPGPGLPAPKGKLSSFQQLKASVTDWPRLSKELFESTLTHIYFTRRFRPGEKAQVADKFALIYI